VDVSGKDTTRRSATARSVVALPVEVAAAFDSGELMTKKGPVVQTAIIAGTMAVKKTAELIPFCHPLAIRACDFATRLDGQRLVIDCSVSVDDRTGVEMEALTGATVAALTVYDMLKALSHDIRIVDTALQAKSGGKRDFRRDEPA
jgi:cyclic pyranopterin phosphate synthase